MIGADTDETHSGYTTPQIEWTDAEVSVLNVQLIHVSMTQA